MSTLKGLDDILNFEFFETSACIKKFYNSTEKNYKSKKIISLVHKNTKTY